MTPASGEGPEPAAPELGRDRLTEAIPTSASPLQPSRAVSIFLSCGVCSSFSSLFHLVFLSDTIIVRPCVLGLCGLFCFWSEILV